MDAFVLRGLPFETLLPVFGGIAAGVVLLYLVRTRRRRVRVPFSPLWQRVLERQRASSPLRILRHILSLLVQLAVLGCLVLALGDPAPPADAAPALPPRHTVLVVDTSASMQAADEPGGRLAVALARAARIIDAAGPGDRLLVAEWDADVRPLTPFSEDRALLKRQLADIRARDVASRPAALLGYLRATLAGKSRPEAVLVSDGAFEPPAAADLPPFPLTLERVGLRGGNLGFVGLGVRPEPDDSLNYTLHYRVQSDLAAAVRGTVYLYAAPQGLDRADFVRDEHMVGSFALTVPAGDSAAGQLRGVRFAGSRLAARFEPDAEEAVVDIFPTDDVAFAVVPARRRLRVQLVSDGNLYLYAALLVRENVALTRVQPTDFKSGADYDLTVFDNVTPPDPGPGNYLYLNPQGPASPFPVRGVRPTPPLVRIVAPNHPLARGLTLVDLNVAEMTQLEAQPGDTVVARAGDAGPVLLARSGPTGRSVALAFDVRRSDLPLRYAFPLLIVNTLRFVAAEDDEYRAAVATGAPTVRDLPWPAGPVRLRGPGGFAAGPLWADKQVSFVAQTSGIYEWRPDPVAGTAGASAGAPPDGPGEAFAALLGDAGESRVAPRPQPFAADLRQAPPPVAPPPWWREAPWRALLALALLLLGVEWATYHRRLSV